MQKQRDEAIRTKAWISDKKTATAMETASVKSREADKLKIKLDLEMSYATVKKVEIATGRKYDWRNLKKYCVKVLELAGTRRLTQIMEVSIVIQQKPGRMFMVCNFNKGGIFVCE